MHQKLAPQGPTVEREEVARKQGSGQRPFASPQEGTPPRRARCQVFCLPRSKGALSGTKANAEGGCLEKLRNCVQSTARESSCSSVGPFCPQALPALLGSGGFPSFLVPPNRRRSSAPSTSAPLRTSRTPGRSPRMVWPSVAATPFGSDSCSSCSGWSAGAPSRGCLGRRAGGGEHWTTSAGCRAREQPPAGNREAEGRQRDRLQWAGEDRGWASLTPVSTCCSDPPRPPFTAPTPRGIGPHQGRSLLQGHWLPREQRDRDLLLLGLMIQHHSCPERDLGRVGEGVEGGRTRSVAVLLPQFLGFRGTIQAGGVGQGEPGGSLLACSVIPFFSQSMVQTSVSVRCSL